MDNRRRQYVPLYVHALHGKTGTRIQQELGHAGLLAWVGFLCACKRNPIQGQIEYSVEAEAWRMLGILDPPDWPIEKLWKLTGQLKKTSRTRSGQLLRVTCTVWGEWEQNVRRDHDATKKRRKRAQSTRDDTPTIQRHYDDDIPPMRGTEGEGEDVLQEKTSSSPSVLSPPTRRNARKARAATAGTNTPKATGWRYTRNVRAEHWIRDPEGTDKPPRHIVQSWNEAEDRRQAAEHEQPNTDDLPPVDPQAATRIRELAAQALPKNTR